MINELNFYKLIKTNYLRYIYKNANLAIEDFELIMKGIKFVYDQYEAIMNDYQDHKFLTIHKIQEYI